MKRALLTIPFGVVALGACHKDPPAPVALVVDAAPPSIAIVDAAAPVDASEPIGAPVPDASTNFDAIMAGSQDLKVLVHKEQGEGGMLSLDGLVRTINRAVAAGKPDAGVASRVVVYVDTTIDYGCSCPPWVFAPFWNTGRSDGYVYPTFAPGVPEAPLVKQGLMRFAGHFDGTKITGFEWLKRRHEKPEEEGADEFANKGPVFVVEGWCFEPAEEFSSIEVEKALAKDFAKMKADGRLCVGTHLPKHATE